MPDLRKCIYCGGPVVFGNAWKLANGKRKRFHCKYCRRTYSLTFNNDGEVVGYDGAVRVAQAEMKAARGMPCMLSDNQRRWEAALRPEPENELSREEIERLLPTVTTRHLRARLEAIQCAL